MYLKVLTNQFLCNVKRQNILLFFEIKLQAEQGFRVKLLFVYSDKFATSSKWLQKQCSESVSLHSNEK